MDVDVYINLKVPPLTDVLKSVPDFRSRHGRRYTLASILSLGIAATLCGANSYGAMAEWGKNYGAELAETLGFPKGKTPSVGTLFTVFSQVDKAALEAALCGWNEAVLAALNRPVAVAVDGKTLRGTRTQNAVQSHLLSAVSHGLGLTLQQQGVSTKENEIPAMSRLLCDLVVEGRVFTMDALLTQKDIARAIVSKKGTS